VHSKIYVYEITCPKCGTKSVGFFGNNEDGSFCCNSQIEVKMGQEERTDTCGYSREKLHHMPEGSCKRVATITLKDSKPVIEYE
jgi:hypothetical protein